MIDRALKIIVFLVAAAPAFAQGVTPTPAGQKSPDAANPPAAAPDASDTSRIILAPKAPAKAPDSAAAGQPAPTGIEADLVLDAPKFNPETAAAKTGESPDLRDVDKPRNSIPRLPAEVMSRYVVHGARIPEFRPRDLYTKAGLVSLALKEHPGFHIGNFFNLNAAAAYEAFMEDENLREKAEFADTAFAIAVGGDPAEAKLIMEETGNTHFQDQEVLGPAGAK